MYKTCFHSGFSLKTPPFLCVTEQMKILHHKWLWGFYIVSRVTLIVSNDNPAGVINNTQGEWTFHRALLLISEMMFCHRFVKEGGLIFGFYSVTHCFWCCLGQGTLQSFNRPAGCFCLPFLTPAVLYFLQNINFSEKWLIGPLTLMCLPHKNNHRKQHY